MKLRLGNRMAAPVLDQMARWLPARAEQFRRMADKAQLGLEISVEPIKPRRTTDQNARYWLIVSALADYVGMTKGEMHEEVLASVYGYDTVEFRGSVRKRPKQRSSKQARDDFSKLIETADQWAAELGINWEGAA